MTLVIGAILFVVDRQRREASAVHDVRARWRDGLRACVPEVSRVHLEVAAACRSASSSGRIHTAVPSLQVLAAWRVRRATTVVAAGHLKGARTRSRRTLTAGGVVRVFAGISLEVTAAADAAVTVLSGFVFSRKEARFQQRFNRVSEVRRCHIRHEPGHVLGMEDHFGNVRRGEKPVGEDHDGNQLEAGIVKHDVDTSILKRRDSLPGLVEVVGEDELAAGFLLFSACRLKSCRSE